MYPLKFIPIYKEKIWGGRRIAKNFNQDVPVGSIGESWQLAAHDNGTSKIANGRLAGQTLMEAIEEEGENILGKRSKEEFYYKFPLLIKILDANNKLSVQVHPDGDYAAQYEDGELGKTEMWYVIDAEPDAQLVYGVKPNVSKEKFKASINKGELDDDLVKINVATGDVIYIPTGTVHSILGGVLIAEIQQNSDTTYRVYDWNRVGKDGKPRELHVDSALDVINFGKEPESKVEGLEIKKKGYVRNILVACPYFITETLDIKNKYKSNTKGERFYILMVLTGEAKLNYGVKELKLKAGETILVPASLGKYEIKGNCKLIKSYVQNISLFKKELEAEGYSKENLKKIKGLEKFIKE